MVSTRSLYLGNAGFGALENRRRHRGRYGLTFAEPGRRRIHTAGRALRIPLKRASSASADGDDHAQLSIQTTLRTFYSGGDHF
jgi:hypothetical protein